MNQNGKMLDDLILTAGPSITDLEIKYVMDAVENGWNQQWNKYLTQFEQSFAEKIGVRYAISTSSCTGAMHLSLLAMGISEGDEVLVPELSWIATAAAVRYVGAEPVFCDIDPVSWCIDPTRIEEKIGPKTRAIMPVHLYGHPCEMDPIIQIANQYGLKILEDAAPSLGATYKNQYTGSFGDAAAFSFQGAKVLVTGEGGMFVTNDEKLYNCFRHLGDHGRDPSNPLSSNAIGYKYKMSNLQAALGLAQLERIDDLVQRKREIHDKYRELLSDVNQVKLSSEAENCRSIHWMSSVEIEGLDVDSRNLLMKTMLDNGVDTRPVFSPMSSFPMFASNPNNEVAYRIGRSSINLPSGHNLTEEQQEKVVRVLLKAL